MKLVLSHSYFLDEDPIEQKIMRPYPPLGLASISAWLDRSGIEHELIDTTFGNRAAFLDHMVALQPDVVAFYATLMTRKNVIALAREIRARAGGRKVTFVLGGPDTRYNAADYLANGIDYLVVGEGEQTMEDLARALRGDRGAAVPADIPGLIHANNQGGVVFTPERALLPSIDDLPLPARHRLDLGRYLSTWKDAHGVSSINVSTQRGCPYSCKWCSRTVYGKSYRRRSAGQVVAELQGLVERYQPDQFWFVDDVFTINHRWLEQFALELKNAGLSIRYECITRAERMNDRVVELLAETGCRQVWIGAESGSQRILDAMDRKVSIETVTRAMQQARAAGIRTGTFLMLGYPGEEETDIHATLDYLKKARPDEYTITLAYPIKGTELYEELAHRVELPDFATGSDREIRFKRTYRDDYYRHALAYLNHAMALEAGKPATALASGRTRLAVVRARAGMILERWRSDPVSV